MKTNTFLLIVSLAMQALAIAILIAWFMGDANGLDFLVGMTCQAFAALIGVTALRSSSSKIS